MQVTLSSIVIHDRVRKDIGNLGPLMESMQKHGQLSPIVISRTNELIAGHRRWLAAKRLGWFTVDAVVVDRDSPVERLEMELEENVHRKDFSPEELLAGYRRLDKLRRPGLGTRVRRFFGRLFGGLFRRGSRGDNAAPAAPVTPLEATAGDDL